MRIPSDNVNANVTASGGSSINIGNGSVYGNISIAITATALRVGAGNLTGRKQLWISNECLNTAFIGFDSSVTIDNGIPIHPGEVQLYEVDDTITIYGIRSSANGSNIDLRIGELK